MILNRFLKFINTLHQIQKTYYKDAPVIVKISTPILLIHLCVSFTLMFIHIIKKYL